jgi:hypothetical protein
MNRNRRLEVRRQILALFGGACRCCGERQHQFLTLDHVHNDGNAERRIMPNYFSLFRRLLRQGNADKRYQLLCWNCNCAKAHYSRCPHKAGRRQAGA